MCSFHDNEVTVFEHHAGAVDTGDSDVIAVWGPFTECAHDGC